MLLSFDFSSTLMGAANQVRICQNPFCCEVHYLTTKMIQIKPYIICSSHQLGLEVRYYVVPFFAILQDKRNIFSFMRLFQASSSVYEVSYPCLDLNEQRSIRVIRHQHHKFNLYSFYNQTVEIITQQNILI